MVINVCSDCHLVVETPLLQNKFSSWLIWRNVMCLVVTFDTDQALHLAPSKITNCSRYGRQW